MGEFQGFVFDIDKTAVPNGARTVESQALLDAFSMLPEDVIAVAATGRSPVSALPITRALGLKHDSVVANGALIVDSQTGEHWWERPLTEGQVASIITACKPHPHRLWFADDPLRDHRTAAEQVARSTTGVFLLEVSAETASDMRSRVIEIPGVDAYLAPSWSDDEDMFNVCMNNVEAGKRNALEALFGKYAVVASEMIGVGDGLNDLELFEAVGHRIAVADANPKLMEYADEVIGAHDEDGLVEVLQRFIK